MVLRRLRTPRGLIIAPLSYGETVGIVRRTTGSEIHIYKAYATQQPRRER